MLIQYSIGIVYNVPRRPWGKSEIQIYVDGELKRVAVMKTPYFSDVSIETAAPAIKYLAKIPN